jgi:hypothetical protein
VEEEEEEGEEVKGRYALGAKIPEFVKVGEKGKHFKNLGTSTFSCTVADVIFDAAAALAGAIAERLNQLGCGVQRPVDAPAAEMIEAIRIAAGQATSRSCPRAWCRSGG